jgi:predicted nucleic acid-binding Zn ribbon protein
MERYEGEIEDHLPEEQNKCLQCSASIDKDKDYCSEKCYNYYNED